MFDDWLLTAFLPDSFFDSIMQAFIYLLPLLATFAPTFAAPTKALEDRTSQCGLQSTLSAGTYTLLDDEWGAADGTGSQCSSIDGLNGNSLAWSTTWSWEDNINQVKAYVHVQSSSTYCTQISSISSIPTSWSWRYVTPCDGALQAYRSHDTQLQRQRTSR